MLNYHKNGITTNYKDSKKSNLYLGLIFDCIGLLSYLTPVFAEAIDFVWAPVSAILLVLMYKGTTGKIAGIVSFIEELLPFVDFIPTFTITWIYKYKIKREP